MKILQVITAFHPAMDYGGPSVVALQQAKFLAEAGHEVTVATSNILRLNPARFSEGGKADLDGIEVVYFPSRALHSHPSFIVSREFSGWLKGAVKSFDVVHVHLAREWIPIRGAQIAISEGAATFLQPHGMLGRKDGVRSLIDKMWVESLLEGAAGVFSLQEQEDVEIKAITSQAKVHRLPNGIELTGQTDRWSTDNPAKPTVLFLARLHRRKRVLSFIEMARILKDKDVEARYRIVGPDGGDLAEAMRLVRDYGLGDQVSFIGSQDSQEVAREYLGASVYVLPSVDEPFPMTILEALSLGVPTVVTSSCFIARMLKDNESALVSAPEPEMLAEAVVRILHEPRLAERLSAAGRRLVEEELSMERVSKRLQDYYRGAYARAH